MSNCERFEMQISALIDEELSPREAKQLIDHLLDCQACQQFYREAGTLQQLTEDMTLAAELDGSPVVVPEQKRFILSFPTLPGRRLVWGAAASVAILACLIAEQVIPDPTGFFGAREAVAQTITLGEDSGKMTDGRFVELTTEILKADSDYQHMMYDLLDQVQRSEYVDERTDLIASSGEFAGGARDPETAMFIDTAIY